MGGAIVLSFLANSALGDRVQAVILDSPALDFEALIDDQAMQRRLPGALTALAKFLAARRFGIDYRALDRLERAGALSAPVLLIHGSADSRVPILVSDQLAAARPDVVEYEVFDGAIHVGAWNQDRERYEGAVRRFLVGME